MSGSLLTEETGAAIVAAVRKGAFVPQAAECSGISYHTLKRWTARGHENLEAREEWEISNQRGDDLPEVHLDAYGRFVIELRIAESEAEWYALACVQKAMHSDWRAAAWYLERKNASRYGSKALRLGEFGVFEGAFGDEESSDDELREDLTLKIELIRKRETAHLKQADEKA